MKVDLLVELQLIVYVLVVLSADSLLTAFSLLLKFEISVTLNPNKLKDILYLTSVFIESGYECIFNALDNI